LSETVYARRTVPFVTGTRCGALEKRSTESVSCCEDQAELNCRTGAVSASREVPSGESEPLAVIALDQSCRAAWLARPTSKVPDCLAASPTCISLAGIRSIRVTTAGNERIGKPRRTVSSIGRIRPQISGFGRRIIGR